MCQALNFDFVQLFTDYKANNWFCNLQGTAISQIHNLQAIVSCNCSTGYIGSNCIFTTKDNAYAEKWVVGLDLWADFNLPLSNEAHKQIKDEETFISLINITSNLLNFAPYANENTSLIMENTIERFMNKLLIAELVYLILLENQSLVS